MKKFLYVILIVATIAWAVPGMAAITGTSHELVAEGGACAACHLPHGAVQGGDRLWPGNAATTASGNLRGEVAPLCAYCHHTDGGNTITSAESDDYVWGALSHGVMMSGSNAPFAYTDSGLEYQDDSADYVLECTTCHNVHEDPAGGNLSGERPFLRAGVNELCSGCHDSRRMESGNVVSGSAALGSAFGAWGSASVGLANPGSHPVGIDITGNNMGGDTPVTLSVPEMSVGFDTARNTWTLGGHLTGGDTGGVVCTTCHAVHGVQYDAQGGGLPDATYDTIPNTNFLAIDQDANQTDGQLPAARSIANGHQGFNALCEACHTGTAVDGPTYNSNAGSFNPNPGGTSFGHPVDDMDAADSWVTGGFNGFPEGDAALVGLNVTTTPICESCHVVHPLANANKGRPDEGAGDFVASQYILRDSNADICVACHTGGLKTHHPVGISFAVPGGSLITTLNAITGAGTYTLSCGTCHGSGSGGAHQWDSIADVGLDPNWLPADNGRAATSTLERYNADTSKTCMDCHYGIDGNLSKKSPTLHDGLNVNYIGPNETAGVAGQYAIIGSDTGTHFIGLISSVWDSSGLNAQSLPNNDPELDFWPNGAWSRFGGDGTTEVVLVCESCHDLQPTKNTGYHLLMELFQEEDSVQVDARSDMCEFCHLPPGTHPQSGDTVTKTDTTLTVDMAVAWLQTPNDTNVVMDNGNNIINCDNCHQVHDAADDSYTFILDSDPANLGTPTATTDPTSGGYGTAYVTSVQTAKGGDHNRFCNECHPYN